MDLGGFGQASIENRVSVKINVCVLINENRCSTQRVARAS
jgi:hypothetical protein